MLVRFDVSQRFLPFTVDVCASERGIESLNGSSCVVRLTGRGVSVDGGR